jgi:hypothetical protein
MLYLRYFVQRFYALSETMMHSFVGFASQTRTCATKLKKYMQILPRALSFCSAKIREIEGANFAICQKATI